MKQNGILRRIDVLGRIVIPKEIRDFLHIKTGEILEVYAQDKSSIGIRKYIAFNEKEEFLKKFVFLLSDLFKSNIYITDLSKVLYSNNINLINLSFSKKVESELTLRGYFDSSLKNIFEGVETKDAYKVFPISQNGNLIGFLIFESAKENPLFKFFSVFLNEYFEI